MRIKVNRRLIVKVYCYAYQAERSIHYVLGADWADLREYYRGSRLDGVRSLAQRLGRLVGEDRGQPPSWTVRGWTRDLHGFGAVEELVLYLYRLLVAQWVALYRKHWWLEAQDLGFTASAFRTLVGVLESASRPAQDTLIALRMKLCDCRSMLEDRCYGLPEIKRARWLEHFRQADWVTPVRLADLLGELPDDMRPTRKSA